MNVLKLHLPTTDRVRFIGGGLLLSRLCAVWNGQQKPGASAIHHPDHNQLIEVFICNLQCPWFAPHPNKANTLIKVYRGFMAGSHGKLDWLHTRPRRNSRQSGTP